MEKALPKWPFVILLVVALWGFHDGFQDGRWLVVTLHAATLAIAIWGLRFPRQPTQDRHQASGADEQTGQSPGSRPDPGAGPARSWPPPDSSTQGAPVSVATTTAPAGGDLPVVASFTVTAQISMIATGTTARLSLVLPQNAKITPTEFVAALLTLGQRVLQEHRLTDRQLPEVEVTAVEQVTTASSSARATGFTVGVTNDLVARRSSIALDLDLLLGNDDGILLIAATLLAGAEHLLEVGDPPAHRIHHGRGHRAGSV